MSYLRNVNFARFCGDLVALQHYEGRVTVWGQGGAICSMSTEQLEALRKDNVLTPIPASATTRIKMTPSSPEMDPEEALEEVQEALEDDHRPVRPSKR
jgi:hypothetical protein